MSKQPSYLPEKIAILSMLIGILILGIGVGLAILGKRTWADVCMVFVALDFVWMMVYAIVCVTINRWNLKD